jgi:hypothetical protein
LSNEIRLKRSRIAFGQQPVFSRLRSVSPASSAPGDWFSHVRFNPGVPEIRIKSIRQPLADDKTGRQRSQEVNVPAIPLVVAEFHPDIAPPSAVLDALSLNETDDSSPLAVLTPASHMESVAEVLALLDKQGHPTQGVMPPSSGLFSRFSAGWTRLPAGHAEARFPEISVMSSLVPPRRVLLLHDAQAATARPIESLLHYVHHRLAAAVRFSRPELGAAADVALGFNVAGVLVVAEIGGRQIVAATPDLVAGQLLALALQRLETPDDEDPIGPWEDPVVQRATELGLGVNHPGQLELRCLPENSERMAALSHQLHLLLGMQERRP